MNQPYAHYNPHSDTYQLNSTHNSDTAVIAEKKNPIPILKDILWLTCHLHDSGKYPERWQKYFMKAICNDGIPSGPKEDHTTAGGQLIQEIFPGTLLSEMIQIAIYSHHGLRDCISIIDSSILLRQRMEKAKKLPIEEAKEYFYQAVEPLEFEKRCAGAREESKLIPKRIKDIMKSWDNPQLYGNRDFFLGMYERILLSLLIDADRRDTEDFMTEDGKAVCQPEEYSPEKLQDVWRICVEHVERKYADFTDKSGINRYRSEISDRCMKQALQNIRLYHLTVPTGSGKTLSSLRFAVRHALEYHKRRIIYVAPYQSILDQNAEEIRNALDYPGIVLEHHCNIILETEEEQAHYDRVTEDWSLPVIVTTAVQFLNTLFAGKTGNIRRMHSLCNSVIIMDEVQSLPVRTIQLFNMAVNFLTEFADTTMVLCTATQPLLDRIPVNRLRPPKDMTGYVDFYQEAFRRTEIIDCTDLVPGGMDIRKAAGFVLEKARELKQVLFVVNTKRCARELFGMLESLNEDGFKLYHLSTGMCPEHRSDVLKDLSDCLKSHGEDPIPLICVSTQLIEAGVDLSFRCVIRSLAGLDNIIQAAGRCNRHKEVDMGKVFIVKMSGDAENLSHLAYIRRAQESTEQVLAQFYRNPEVLGGRLDSGLAVKMYYECNFQKWLKEMEYRETVEGVSTSLVELLSGNHDFLPSQQGTTACKGAGLPILKQAFKTAGDLFEAIEENGKTTVIVPYNEEAVQLLSRLSGGLASLQQKKQALRKLQRFTVAISGTEKKGLGDAIHTVWEGRVLVLDERYYDKENLGVTQNPGLMTELMI